jgi:hypothetical protein
MPIIPASGGAAVLSPGTNFASTTVNAPRRTNVLSVLRTQLSGSSETRHRKPRTFPPWPLPIWYHSASLSSDASSREPDDREQVELAGPRERAGRDQDRDRRQRQPGLREQHPQEHDQVAVVDEVVEELLHRRRWCRTRRPAAQPWTLEVLAALRAASKRRAFRPPRAAAASASSAAKGPASARGPRALRVGQVVLHLPGALGV